jgi:hypothetical protein
MKDDQLSYSSSICNIRSASINRFTPILSMDLESRMFLNSKLPKRYDNKKTEDDFIIDMEKYKTYNRLKKSSKLDSNIDDIDKCSFLSATNNSDYCLCIGNSEKNKNSYLEYEGFIKKGSTKSKYSDKLINDDEIISNCNITTNGNFDPNKIIQF